MTDQAEAVPMDDRKAALVAAGLVAAVVLVLGFGSGIFSVLSRDAGSSSSARIGRDLGTDVQGGTVQLGTTPGTGDQGVQPISSVTDGGTASATHMAMSGAPSPGTAASPTTTAPAGAIASAAAAGTATSAPAETTACSSEGTAQAALDPFMVHLDKAHLETSPGQQVGQALSLDQYVKTHTVLVESMLLPVVDAVLATLQALPVFWMHVEKGHLEASPAQQVKDVTATDQYVKTHTVLVEDMLDPFMAALVGTGCGG